VSCDECKNELDVGWIFQIIVSSFNVIFVQNVWWPWRIQTNIEYHRPCMCSCIIRSCIYDYSLCSTIHIYVHCVLKFNTFVKKLNAMQMLVKQDNSYKQTWICDWLFHGLLRSFNNTFTLTTNITIFQAPQSSLLHIKLKDQYSTRGLAAWQLRCSITTIYWLSL
jgi:hypothetical protein